jgi:cellulose biosynthesis protein BcsQ
MLVFRQLLFVGYSVRDKPLIDAIARVEKALPLGSARHFALLESSEVSAFENRLANFNVVQFTGTGEPLLVVLQELGRLVKNRRKKLQEDSGTRLPPRGPQNLKEQRLEDAFAAPLDDTPLQQTAAPQTWKRAAPAFDELGPLVLAFVSGKGGVGKTMLATACASCLAEKRSTLLVDLDFANRGLGKLAGKYGDGIAVSELKGIAVGANPRSGWEVFNVADTKNLWVLSPKLDLLEEYNLKSISPERLSWHLREWLDTITKELGANGVRVDALVLDCHGVADPVSAVATVLSQHSLLIVEPEPVTAQGTVRFLRQIPVLAPRQKANIQVIFNRVPQGISASSLEKIFERQLSPLESCSGLLAYFPYEDYLARSAEQHALLTRDFPDSSLARRTRVWMAELLGTTRRAFFGVSQVAFWSRFLAHRTNGHLHWLLRVDTTVRVLAVGLVLLFATEHYFGLDAPQNYGTWFLTIWSAIILFASWHFHLLRSAQASLHRRNLFLGLSAFAGLISIASFGLTLGLLTIFQVLTILLPNISDFDVGPKIYPLTFLLGCELFFITTSFWRLRPRPFLSRGTYVRGFRWLLLAGYLVAMVACYFYIRGVYPEVDVGGIFGR